MYSRNTTLTAAADLSPNFVLSGPSSNVRPNTCLRWASLDCHRWSPLETRGGMMGNWTSLNCHRWALLETRGRMMGYCRCRAIRRSIGRGGCSQDLLLLLLLLLVVLILSSSTSSSSSSSSSSHLLLFLSLEIPSSKGLSLRGIELMTFRLTAKELTTRPLGLLLLGCDEVSMVLSLLLILSVVDVHDR